MNGDIVLYQDWEMAYEGGGNDSFINKGIVEYCEAHNITISEFIRMAVSRIFSTNSQE